MSADVRKRLMRLPLAEQRAMARRLGLPSDLLPHQVLDFFSMPDDDDTMHMGPPRPARGGAA